MYALFEATRTVDQTWLILMAALIIFGAIAGLATIAARQDGRDQKRGWYSDKQPPPAAYMPDNAGVRISGWVIGLLVLGLAALIYVLAGEVVAGLFQGTVGTLR
jgi:hypothetical protein